MLGPPSDQSSIREMSCSLSRAFAPSSCNARCAHHGRAQNATYPDQPDPSGRRLRARRRDRHAGAAAPNDLQDALGQPVVIENRPGAGGYLAWNHVASSEPDGYTLLLAENALAISQALYKKSKSSFDPLTQYDAVTGIAVVAVGADRRQQRAGQDRGGARGLFEDRAAEDELRLGRHRQRLAPELRGVQGHAPAWRPCTCPTRAAARRSAT